MAKFTPEDDALLQELGVGVDEETAGDRMPREERVIAGFAEIQRFVDRHGRPPEHGDGKDIFERLYAVRLDRLRTLEDCRVWLEPLDRQGLLGVTPTAHGSNPDEMDDKTLLAELGVDGPPDDLANLRHVRSAADKRAAEEIASRKRCEDFERFKAIFDQVRRDLDAGIRRTRAAESMDQIKEGQWFIVGGQIAYVAEVGEDFVTEYDRRDSRLRVIYDNATESDVLLRSLQHALWRDGTGRVITDVGAGPLFSGEIEDGDLASGTIYVLRSRSDHPTVAAHRELVHKIGVTGGDVVRRLDNARRTPTFLMADVDIVATYKLSNINRARLEAVIHRVFEPARLDIEIMDRFGSPVIPREWFLVPIFVIDQAVERIKDGTITQYQYDPTSASLKRSAT